MSLTRITSGVVSSNAISAEKLANGSIASRQISDGAIELRHLTTAANSAATIDTVSSNLTANLIQITANVNAVQANVNAQTVNVNIVQSNLAANVANASAFTANVEARRVANIAGAISTVLTSDLTASRALISGSGGKIEVSPVTSTELGYVDGVTSAIQTQINTLDSNADANFVQLNANLNVLDANADAIETRRTANIAGAISTVLTADLTASRALVSSSGGKIEVSAVTSTELGYLDGVTGAIQTQLDSKQATITGSASTIDTESLTADRAVISNGSQKIAVSDVTSTELGYLDGVTGAIQTQIDAKAALAGATFSGQVNMNDDLVVTGNLIVNGDTTTANSVNMVVQDRMLMLANSATGAPGSDVGILFNRGNQGNAAFFYDESASTFKLSDTKDPSSNTLLSPVTASNLDVGIVTAATVKQNGANLDDLISSNVDGAISTVHDTNLTASRALASSGSGKIEVSAVTATELGYLDGVTGAIQTQLDAKQATITGAATTIDDADLTASRALVSSSSGKVEVSDVTSTELGHLDGVTSAIQTQFTAAETRRTNNIAGAVSTITTSDLTASRALVSNGSGKVAISDVTSTELGHLDGVTSAIQTQLNAKQATITGAATTIDDADLTASRALVSSGAGKVAVSDVTSTELGHLDGVTSAIQTQINSLTTNINTLDSNADANFTQLNANINVVSGNVALGLTQKTNVITSTGANTFHVATPPGSTNPSAIGNVQVFIDGLAQKPKTSSSDNDYIYTSGSGLVTVTDASLPSGLTVQITALYPPS